MDEAGDPSLHSEAKNNKNKFNWQSHWLHNHGVGLQDILSFCRLSFSYFKFTISSIFKVFLANVGTESFKSFSFRRSMLTVKNKITNTNLIWQSSWLHNHGVGLQNILSFCRLSFFGYFGFTISGICVTHFWQNVDTESFKPLSFRRSLLTHREEEHHKHNVN